MDLQPFASVNLLQIHPEFPVDLPTIDHLRTETAGISDLKIRFKAVLQRLLDSQQLKRV